MDPIKIIKKYYQVDSKAYQIIIKHSQEVIRKALKIANKVKKYNPDLKFIKEACMFHDIGIIKVQAPEIGCFGNFPYISHGYLGREILEKEGLPKYALVCERHTGIGITLEEIKNNNLPLPLRDMIPISIEEQLICFADKFFSKNKEDFGQEKSIESIRNQLSEFGKNKVNIFNSWLKKFNY